MSDRIERELCQTRARGRGDRPYVGATPRVAAPIMNVFFSKEES